MKMNTLSYFKKRLPLSLLLASLLLLFISFNTYALDNPETGDLVGKFEEKANKLETDWTQKPYDYEMHAPYRVYEEFLDKELNKTYKSLLKNLKESEKKPLILSQKKWLAYRNAEIEFIKTNWNMENFGTSSRFSKKQYISSITRDRIVTLLYYLQNY
jgi:uncharacterized protein YecT (DUF1311 family)